MNAPLPDTEEERLEALRRLDILDTPFEESFDCITRLAASILETPIAVISLVDENRQWFKSRVGLDVAETPRNVAFCAHAILEDTVMVVNDATQDPRFSGNPLVVEQPKIRFYAGAPLKGPDGHNLGTLCIIDMEPREISEEQKVRLRDLSRLSSDLLNLRVANAAIQASMDEAIRANRAKSDFLSSMSHELRTPMNSILGFAQLLYDDPDDPLSENHQRFTKRILDGGRHLLVLIDQVLDLSRIESGRLAMTLADVDVCQSIHDCLNMTETIASERQVSLSAGEGVKGALPCRADPHRFSQILLNLLSNAIKYNREGGTVCVDAAPCEPGWLRISVADSGQGIPSERHAGLFEAFNRLGREQSDIPGSGIGLTISKQLVELMGGRIGFASEVGRGSTFWFDLPLA